MPIDNLAYLLRHDSIYGPSPNQIKTDGESLVVYEDKINYEQNENPDKLPWKELKIDVVLECTGKFSDRINASKHLSAGAKKVLLSTEDHQTVKISFKQRAQRIFKSPEIHRHKDRHRDQ
jgi:glyceraldehyde 3-phosphate dehydrogenase